MKKIVVIVSVVLLATISFLSFGLPVSNAQAGFEVWSMGHTQTTVSIEWNNLTPPSSSPGTVNSYQYTVFASVNGTDGPFIIAGNISAGICIGTFTGSVTLTGHDPVFSCCYISGHKSEL